MQITCSLVLYSYQVAINQVERTIPPPLKPKPSALSRKLTLRVPLEGTS